MVSLPSCDVQREAAEEIGLGDDHALGPVSGMSRSALIE